MSNFFAQTEALLMGKTKAQVKDKLAKRGLVAEQTATVIVHVHVLVHVIVEINK
jgi:hypothetical protein